MYHIFNDFYDNSIIEKAMNAYSTMSTLEFIRTLLQKIGNGNYFNVQDLYTDVESIKASLMFGLTATAMSNAELEDLHKAMAVFDETFKGYKTSIEPKVDDIIKSTEDIEERIRLLRETLNKNVIK